ncbi:dephospho-CoA kinase [Leuconostoc pseudomesenteroides]|uniref:dephospho-CoA kinase n=1 Tax=Leuconostoc pseudomesenteroides TaxID=33968 RepID=UPI002285F398|nr:dephospho-CoA kinase [Leuconostoc pseudomesenteroides]WAM39044.1 dephospho-CoA kinase [Leuconostoc pseudomesenteroides]
MLLVGLTGGIATGKSTVSGMLRDAGLPIVDADVVAREVVEPGTTTLEKIKLAFGPSVIDNGVLNRRRLGDIVFSNRQELARLNDIMQPAITRAMADKINFWRMQQVPILILDVPLLFERHYEKDGKIDKIIVVATDEATQLERLKLRNQLSDLQARNRIRSQLPLKDKVAQADYVIDNNQDQKSLTQQVAALIENLKEIAANDNTN